MTDIFKFVSRAREQLEVPGSALKRYSSSSGVSTPCFTFNGRPTEVQVRLPRGSPFQYFIHVLRSKLIKPSIRSQKFMSMKERPSRTKSSCLWDPFRPSSLSSSNLVRSLNRSGDFPILFFFLINFNSKTLELKLRILLFKGNHFL